MDEKNKSDESEIKTEKSKEGFKYDYGFDLFPERRNEKGSSVFKSFSQNLGREHVLRMKCEQNVLNVIEKYSTVKLLLAALKSSGCPVNLERHFKCEPCDISLLGGYDPQLNQVVVCQNVSTSEGRVATALSHELIHMFDYCRNEVDFSNLSHVACAEIKAATLTSCSFLTALTLRTFSYLDLRVRDTHKECVKTKAAWTIMKARNLTRAEADAAIDPIFEKCYNDREPIGLIPRRKSDDYRKAYRERFLYGYE